MKANQEAIANRLLKAAKRETRQNEALDVVAALIAAAAVIAPDCCDEVTFVGWARYAFQSAVESDEQAAGN